MANGIRNESESWGGAPGYGKKWLSATLGLKTVQLQN
ncbi:MAG: hypothetical protein ACI8P0_001147, partial [Planctomycetaceae bacterium]